MTILFYTTGQDYDIFSNVTDIGFVINVDGKRYSPRSSEAVYQGVKGLTGPYTQRAEALIADTGNPGGRLQREGGKLNPDPMIHNNYTGGYDPSGYTYANAAEPHFSKPRTQITVKEQLMYEILLVKFTQNPDILKALLDTGDETIIENTQIASYDDSFWGNGHGNNGHNALGHALMRVRQDLAKELQDTGKIQVRIGFSQNLATTLGHTSHAQLSNHSITQQQLDTTTACTCTVNRASQSSNSQTNHSRPITTIKETPATYVQRRVLNKTGVSCIVEAVQDTNAPNRYCVQLKFANDTDLQTFLAKVKIGKNPQISGSTLILGPNRAPKVLQALGVATYGHKLKRSTYDALGDSIQRQNTAHAPSQNNQGITRQSHNVTQGSTTSQYNQNRLFHNSLNPVSSSSSPQTALQFVKQALQKKGDSGIQAQMLNANKDKYVLVLRFQDQAAANTFKNKYNLTMPNFGNNLRLLALDQATAEKLFNDPQQLNLPKYGRTNPKPTWQALVFQHEQKLVQTLSPYDQAKIQKIDNLINVLEREINSRWPYPNKALKRLKVEALKTIKTHVLGGDTFDVVITDLRKTGVYNTIIQGKHSHRVYDLLQELAPNAKSSLLSFRY